MVLESFYRQSQAANARAAELVLRARAPAQLGSQMFDFFARVVQRIFGVSPSRSKQIVGGRWFQSLVVPALELPALPFIALGLAWGFSMVGVPWAGVILGSLIMARMHGKPESVRGPPDWAGLSKRGGQTYRQFLVCFYRPRH